MASTGVADMTWEAFFRIFDRVFALAIEVHRLVREFQDLQQTIETVVEIIAKFKKRVLLIP